MQDTFTRRRVLAVAGSATIAGFAGCSSGGAVDDGTTSTTTSTTESDDHGHGVGDHHTEIPDAPHDHVEVSMVTTDSGEFHFSPHVAWVKPGGSVTWVNESGSHTTTAYHPDNDKPLRIPEASQSWDSGLFTEHGKTFEQTFDVTGVYDYYCAPHEGRGMLGTVVVGEPDLHDTPGMAPPQEELPGEAKHKIEELNGMVDEMLGHHHE